MAELPLLHLRPITGTGLSCLFFQPQREEKKPHLSLLPDSIAVLQRITDCSKNKQEGALTLKSAGLALAV